MLDSPSAQSDLASVPSFAWEPVIPQLVSQLASTESDWVREQLQRILVRVAEVCPAAVIFAAVAASQGSGSNGTNIRANARLESLLDDLRPRRSVMIANAASFCAAVTELALLEDERWHAVLQEAHVVLTRRLAVAYPQLKALRDEGIVPLTSVMAEEYNAALAPVVAALQSHLEAAKASPPVSAHATKFLEKSQLITRVEWVISQLQRPLELTPDNPGGELEGVLQRPLNCIKAVISEVAASMASDTKAQLPDLSPALAALGNRDVPLPGAPTGVTICKIFDSVHILRTKTRPKRITMSASDGSTRHFLIKSGEDLRVDAYVSAFLQGVQSAVAASGECRGDTGIRPLLVVPVAPRAGIVGWVDGTVPMYEMYAGHQARQADRSAWVAAAKAETSTQRAPLIAKETKDMTRRGGGRREAKQTAAQQAKKEKEDKRIGRKRGADKSTAATKGKGRGTVVKDALPAAEAAAPAKVRVVPPVEDFLTRIKAAGVDTSKPRSTWPSDTLKKVHLEIARAAPGRLVADELLLGAAGPTHWWHRQRSFTTSTAAMSVLGHVLGLGDRHLDNILFDTEQGGVVHVDFGVLFDRGAKLGVPEVVPFRLTQVFVAGLGPIGKQPLCRCL